MSRGREWNSEGVIDGETGESMEEEEETDVGCGVSETHVLSHLNLSLRVATAFAMPLNIFMYFVPVSSTLTLHIPHLSPPLPPRIHQFHHP